MVGVSSDLFHSLSPIDAAAASKQAAGIFEEAAAGEGDEGSWSLDDDDDDGDDDDGDGDGDGDDESKPPRFSPCLTFPEIPFLSSLSVFWH